MENQNINPLEYGMQVQPKEKTNPEEINSKVQDSNAENVLGTLASIIIWAGTIICCIAFFVGFIMLVTHIDSWGGEEERTIGAIIMGASIVLYISILVSWASLKMMVNISRNIFVIKETLLKNNTL